MPRAILPAVPRLIVNPNASRVTPELVAAVERELSEVETVLTRGPGHAAELAAEALGDIGLQVEAERLRASLRRQFPHLAWSQPPSGTPQAGPESASLSGTVDRVHRLGQMEEPERALGQRYPGGRLEGIDAAAREEVAEPDAAFAYVVPHAGYRWSGPTAAHVYARLAGREVDVNELGESGISPLTQAVLCDDAALVPLQKSYLSTSKTRRSCSASSR